MISNKPGNRMRENLVKYIKEENGKKRKEVKEKTKRKMT